MKTDIRLEALQDGSSLPADARQDVMSPQTAVSSGQPQAVDVPVALADVPVSLADVPVALADVPLPAGATALDHDSIPLADPGFLLSVECPGRPNAGASPVGLVPGASPMERPSLTLALLQAREAAMLFFRPLLNRHGLTEQQWRVIRVLYRHGVLESHCLADLVCILKPSMTGVLQRMERNGMVRRYKASHDQRRVFVELTEAGRTCFERMSGEVESSYARLQEKFSEEKIHQLLMLLDELRVLHP